MKLVKLSVVPSILVSVLSKSKSSHSFLIAPHHNNKRPLFSSSFKSLPKSSFSSLPFPQQQLHLHYPQNFLATATTTTTTRKIHPSCTSLQSSSSSSSEIRSNQDQPLSTATTTAAAIMKNNNDSSSSTKKKNICQFCNEEFASRNAIFRHLRSSTDCYNRAKEAAAAAAPNDTKNVTRRDILELDKRKVAIQFGYYVPSNNNTNSTTVTAAAAAAAASSDTLTTKTPEHLNTTNYTNETAANRVWNSFFKALVSLYPSSPVEEGKGGPSSITQASAAKLRHPSLSQEISCSAASDVIGIHYKGGPQQLTNQLVKRMQDIMDEDNPYSSDNNNSKDNNLLDICILNVESIPVSTKFHAEQSCSQRAYHYIMPLRWLDESKESAKWVRGKVDQQRQANQNGHHSRTYNTPASILKFKEALKCAESRDVQQHQEQQEEDQEKKTCAPSETGDVNDKGEGMGSATASATAATTSIKTTLVPSRGRFGALWLKERRPWHNFCDPSLGGMASPSNEPVWRSVDRARLSGFLLDNDDEPLVVLEFRGDGFVKGQIRRMVASAFAIAKGWLPPKYFDIATRSDICIETPVAPEGRLYFSSSRFHFVELVSGNTLFDTKSATNTNQVDKSKEWLHMLQSHLLDGRRATVAIEEEQSWLGELEHVTSIRIQNQLDKVAADDAFREKQIQNRQKDAERSRQILLAKQDADFSTTPKVYEKTLSLLRNVCQEKKWPVTSGARSRIIRSPTVSRTEKTESDSFQDPSSSSKTVRATSSHFQGQVSQCGSFTVVNPQLFNGSLPMGNELFPDLVKAVFQLEEELAFNTLPAAEGMEKIVGRKKRELSTHCAVNRNAEFTPHVDSGKGQGQSFSMIVGLGDYVGGELVVEGNSYGVRYQPLEFDGWKQIHSTEPFEGERYSLVWFTPEKREESFVCAGETKEDVRARLLVDAHTLALPHFPVLKFRKNSTDALVINEILDTVRGCAYELAPKSLGSALSNKKLKTNVHQFGFSPKGHKAVLDIGAHIGVFSRYALSLGCEKVIAYEPEPVNLMFLKQNLKQHGNNLENTNERQVVEIHGCAVAHGDAAMKNLVHARTRNDGTLNTWRHSLEDYSQYVDKAGTKLPSKAQETVLTRSQVTTVPFFGSGGALQPGITFVKLDCEGAEVDILLSEESSQMEMWLDVTNVVFEWSFTKERRVERFHRAIQNLEVAGFHVIYEGQGSWWDTETNCMWPYHNDLVVFAIR